MTEETPEPTETVVQRGLYYDELREGARYVHTPGRTVSDADNTLFSALTMNPQALHVDAVAAADTEFGRPLVNSMWTLSTMVGLSVGHLTQGTLIAQLGLSDISFPHPVFAGDTLRVESTVVSKRASRSRPGQGIVVLAHVARNQHGTIVAEATRTALMKMTPEESS
ncbi:MaoC family dehydratase [Microbacterium sp. YY-01]|uniref:MaoC family dehydratase n=1 Tax=Microbacterium sp. YY-01 TaxID=3421634 RepID=UPI003D164DFE